MIETPVLVISRKQVVSTFIAIFLPALSWTGVDYVRTRDVAQAAKTQGDRHEVDIRDLRKDTLQMLLMMNKQFTGDTLEIARLTAELNALKAKEAK